MADGGQQGLTAWAMGAKAGESIEYFSGYLPNSSDLGVKAESRALFNAGYVDLVQRRLGNFQYGYIAIKKEKIQIPFDDTDRECFWEFGGKIAAKATR